MKLLKWLTWFQWLGIAILMLIFVSILGVGFGYLDGELQVREAAAISVAVDIQTQFDLGIKDYQSKNFELAKQRFEYVLQQNPDYPQALEMLSETILRINEQSFQPVSTRIVITEAPTPTSTLSPTPDTRAIDELAVAARDHLLKGEWKNLVSTIIALRNIDPLYHVIEFDKALYLALYFGGIEKILEDGDLEGGLYDLALAEQFAPLDSQAAVYQEWARLYQIGMSFWGVYPDQSVYYFSQLASAAPYLRDLSGVAATTRYRWALIQYGDQLALAEEYCLAIEQYNLAQSYYNDQNLQPTIDDVFEQCQISIATYTPTITFTPTFTLTTTVVYTGTPTSTPTFTQTPYLTSTPTPQYSPTPTLETTPIGSPTQTSTTSATSTTDISSPTPTSTETITPPSMTPTTTSTNENTATLESIATSTPTPTPETP